VRIGKGAGMAAAPNMAAAGTAQPTLRSVTTSAGRYQQREFTVLAETDLRTADQFNDLIISDASGYLVRLRDVGEARIGARHERTITRYMGNPAVALGVVKQSMANPLEVSEAVKAALPKIAEVMPEGMRIDIGYDSSIFIAKSIDNVFETIIEAVVFIVLVIFVFLRSFRATLIPIVTIPVSLVGAFTFMWLFGFSINTLTLLALVLAVGLVVDDAIVMLENISRHVEEGVPPLEAAIKGAREISFAVIAMTITLAAVYAPIGFQTGRTGRLFTEFAWTLAGAVLISGFVALTLSPMMCSRLLRHQEQHNFLYRWTEAALNGLTRGCAATLRGALNVKLAVVLGMLLVAAAATLLFQQLPSELSPTEDRGTIVALGIAPEGSTPAYTDQYVKWMEAIFRDTPFVERFFTVIGFSGVMQGINFVRLVDWEERPVKQQDVTKSLFPKLFVIPGLLAFASNPPSLGQSPVDKPVQYVLQSSQPYEVLQAAVDQLTAAARQNPGLQNLDSDLKLNKPQLKVDIDREKAALLGIDVESIGRTVETMLGGQQVTRFKRDGK
jgi:multidrug efflux pump